MSRKVFCVLSLWFPLVALAASGDSGWTSISASDIQIISDGSPRALVYVTVNNSGCTFSTPVLVMDGTIALATSMYATLLTAKASGQMVDIETSGCTSTGYPVIIAIHAQ